FVASFVGTPPMSLLTGADGVAGPLRTAAPLPGPCVLGVRAEHVRLVPGDTALVAAVEDHGHELHVVRELAGGRLLARTPVGAAPARGSRTGVEVDPRDVRGWPA